MRTVASATVFATRTLLMLPLVLSSLAFAADKTPAKSEASFGTGKASGLLLTKEQLRSCIARRDNFMAKDAELVKEQAAIAAQKTEIKRIGDELKTRLESIDRTNAEVVSSYNEAVSARDQQIDSYQARVTSFIASVEANKLEQDSFAQGCSNRRYLEEDEVAIRKGQ